MFSKKGRQIHGRAEKAREEGRFLEALKLCDEAAVTYQKEGDILGLAEVQASKQSTFKHLYWETNDKNYLILEKHAAEAAVEIAEACAIKEALAIPYHNLGKYYEATGNHRKASYFFKKAVENMINNPPQMHNRPGVVADIKGHQFAAEYLAGNKNALKKTEAALEELEQSGEDKISKFNFDVWVSGAHLRIAYMLRGNNRTKSIFHLQKAKKIIDGNKALKLRLQQWKKLAKTFKN